MSEFTQNDNKDIELAKRIISTAFALLGISMPAAILALSELLLRANSTKAKNMQDLKKLQDDWYNNVYLEYVYATGQDEIDFWKTIKAKQAAQQAQDQTKH